MVRPAVGVKRVRVEVFPEPLEIDGVPVTSRAVLRCGCSLFLGDDVVLGRSCCAPHEAIIERALTDAAVTDASAAVALERAEHKVRPWLADDDDEESDSAQE